MLVSSIGIILLSPNRIPISSFPSSHYWISISNCLHLPFWNHRKIPKIHKDDYVLLLSSSALASHSTTNDTPRVVLYLPKSNIMQTTFGQPAKIEPGLIESRDLRGMHHHQNPNRAHLSETFSRFREGNYLFKHICGRCWLCSRKLHTSGILNGAFRECIVPGGCIRFCQSWISIVACVLFAQSVLLRWFALLFLLILFWDQAEKRHISSPESEHNL